MDCKTFALLLDVSPEERSAEEQQQMQEHAQHCEACAALQALLQDCREMDAQEALPPEFTMGWRAAVRKEEAMEKKQAKKHLNWQRMLATAAAVVLVFGGAMISYTNEWGLQKPANGNNSLSYSSKQANGTQVNYMLSRGSESHDTAAQGEDMVMMTKSTADAAAVKETKLIRTINYTIKTSEYDADFEELKQLTATHGGRVESLSISGDTTNGEMRYAYFTLRIPAQQLDDFLGSAKNVGVATSYSEYTEDVSETYYDIVSRLDTQKAKLARLTELLAKAEDMSDLIEIESAISDTQYQIDRYNGQLNGYDSRVNYSYVYVTLRELKPNDLTEIPDATLLDRIVNAVKTSVFGLGNFAQALVIFLVAALPWCGVLLVIVVAYKGLRRISRKKKKE